MNEAQITKPTTTASKTTAVGPAMISRLSHPFAAFFARNGLVVSSDPLLPFPNSAAHEEPMLDGSGGNGSRRGGSHSPKAA